MLKEHLILTGVDKAPKDIPIICKQFYINTIKHELDKTKTYVEVDTSENDIIKSHIQFCKKFKIKWGEMSLPFIHLTPKFHKDNLDLRYIAAAKRSSLKSLSKIMSKVLKLLDRTKSYSDKYQFNSKIKDKAIADLNYQNHTFHGHSIIVLCRLISRNFTPHDKFIE